MSALGLGLVQLFFNRCQRFGKAVCHLLQFFGTIFPLFAHKIIHLGSRCPNILDGFHGFIELALNLQQEIELCFVICLAAMVVGVSQNGEGYLNRIFVNANHGCIISRNGGDAAWYTIPEDQVFNPFCSGILHVPYKLIASFFQFERIVFGFSGHPADRLFVLVQNGY